jgi:hypothetical protein
MGIDDEAGLQGPTEKPGTAPRASAERMVRLARGGKGVLAGTR